MPSFDVKALQDARRAPRFPTRLDGEIVVDRRRSAIRICDISRVGALVRGPMLPATGSEVVLKARALEVVATVIWRRDDACGLNFHRQVEPLEVVRQNAPELARFRVVTAGRTTSQRG